MRSKGAKEDAQVKGFVPVRTKGLFDGCRRFDLHIVYTDVGDWIGEAEHVPLDEPVRGNDYTIIIISKSQVFCVVVDGSQTTGSLTGGRTSQFNRLRPVLPARKRQHRSNEGRGMLVQY